MLRKVSLNTLHECCPFDSPQMKSVTESLIPLMGRQSPGRFLGLTHRPIETHHESTHYLNVGPSSAPTNAGCGPKQELEPRVDITNKI